ncbi:hypothetical protein HGRIS_006375 [Hohenbuehelia grisea]|uniref:Uncharacterized protein n=1 Tax=Hohenbuehelia grisea TaxID=104357 RepID=A0ABR3JZR3_9AGAR
MADSDAGLVAGLRALSIAQKPVGEAETARIAGRYTEAKEHYLSVLKELVRDQVAVPLSSSHPQGGVKNDVYMKLSNGDKVGFMCCCVYIAQCLLKESDIEQALYWLEEVNVMYQNVLFSLKEPLWDWDWDLTYWPEDPRMSFVVLTSRCLASDIFLSLGNSGTAVWQRYWTNYPRAPMTHISPQALEVYNQTKLNEIIRIRHPDPALTPSLKVTVPSLQVLGSWKKLDAKKMNGLMQRLSFSTFIWKGYLYLAGGRKDSLGPFYRDLWRLNLKKLGSWTRLPDYPIAMSSSGAFLGWTIIPYNDKAYLFTGRPNVDVFDLVTQQWSSFRTSYTPTSNDRRHGGIEGRWMYPGSQLTDSTQQIVDGKLYVFGGTHGTTNIGCNLFMVLDLQTRQWTRLSGTPMALKPDLSSPGPRKTPSSWVDATNNKIYVFSGECARNGAHLQNEPHGADDGYAFADLWCWYIKEGHWKRERMVGNIPCPRSEVAFTWNPKLGKAIVWGGLQSRCPD